MVRRQESIPVSRNVVLDKMAMVVLVLDNYNRIMYMNASAEAFFCLNAEAVSGFYIEEALSECTELVKVCIEKIDYSEFTRDNRFYRISFSSLGDEQKSVGNMVFIEDITEYKKIENKTLRQKQAWIALQERDRVSRELYDSFGQELGYIPMQIDIPKIKVLLVDDHVLFMNGLQKLIEQYNFEVIGTAKDGYEALEKARLLQPDMILMDIHMPRCNGIIATRLINMEMPDIIIVILTMSDSEQNFLELYKMGHRDICLKNYARKNSLNSFTVSHQIAR